MLLLTASRCYISTSQLSDKCTSVKMEVATFNNDEGTEFKLTKEMLEAFQKFGFLLVKKLFSEKEIGLMVENFKSREFMKNVFTRSNGGERGFQMALWWEPGDDTVGLASRCRRLVETMTNLIGGNELYLLSSKLIMKEANSGGAFAWHQVIKVVYLARPAF